MFPCWENALQDEAKKECRHGDAEKMGRKDFFLFLTLRAGHGMLRRTPRGNLAGKCLAF